MKRLALFVATVVMIIGIVGVVAPDRLIAAGRYVMTPAGLYAIAALRVGMGLVLMLVASSSRTPKVFRALGFLVLLAGLATPFFGVDRSREIIDWAAVQSPTLLRGVAGVMLVLGGFIAWALATGRRSA